MQFLDVGYTYRALKSELDAAVGRVMASGWYVQGGELAAFEAAFARYTGAAACVGVGNGLDALTLTLRAIGCGPGDEVIVPAHTFIATWLAVSATGATVVPVDADPASMNIDLAAAAERVGSRTRAIIPVHLYGLPVDVEDLRRRIGPGAPFILEDAAQAHGARVRGTPAGSLGDAAGFSFYPAKTLGAFGDGGAVTTRDTHLAEVVRRLGNYGSSEKYRHEELGVNSRLDELQAACLTVKLTTLDAWNARRSQIAARYLEALAGLDAVALPEGGPGLESAWHLFVVRVEAPEELATRLSQRGVPTQRHYPIPPHLSGAYAGLFEPGAFPVTERICRSCLSLPIGPHLSDAEVDQVCDAVRACVSR